MGREVKHIISYSGGVGSAITAKRIVDLYGKDNVTLLFADTLIEDRDLYKLNDQLTTLLGCELITIRDGRTPWQVFNDVKFIGNSRIDPCSKILKRDLIRKWLHKNINYKNTIIWIGIDVSEEHRLKPVVIRNAPLVYRSILIEENIWLTPSYKIKWFIDNGLDIPRMYSMGFSHHNCGGFCVKAGLGQFKKLYELLPEVYLSNELEEQKAISINPNLRPFLQKTINGIKTYITLKEYRELYLTSITEDESMEFGACGCAL